MAVSRRLRAHLHGLRRSDSSADVALAGHLLGLSEDPTLTDEDLLADVLELQDRVGVLLNFMRNITDKEKADGSPRPA